MKRSLLTVAVSIYAVCGFAQQKNDVVVKGTIQGNLNGYDKMFMYGHGSSDSAVITGGHYTFTFPYRGMDMEQFVSQFEMKGKHGYRPLLVLVSGPGTYYIESRVSGDRCASKLVGGPEDALLFRDFQGELIDAYGKINDKMQALYGKQSMVMLRGGQANPHQASRDSLQSIYLVPAIENFIKKHPHSHACAFILNGIAKNYLSPAQEEALYNTLSDQVKSAEQGRSVYHYIRGIKNSAVGKTVADFILSDPGGKPIDFESFRGKYVLVDFWASWCGPCRRSFPKMRKIYRQYKDRNFDIYSISIDKNKKAWLKAVEEENNPWPQSLDTKDVQSKDFAVTAIPTTFLIGPKGEIIARQTGFDPVKEGPVEKKLDGLFGPVSVAGEGHP